MIRLIDLNRWSSAQQVFHHCLTALNKYVKLEILIICQNIGVSESGLRQYFFILKYLNAWV